MKKTARDYIPRSLAFSTIGRKPLASAAMVMIGYGKYRNYRIEEVPDAFLSELSERYQLSHTAQVGAEYDALQITIAIHEEIQRRQKGGSALPKEPTAKELAIRLVTKGFQIMSKDFHPDRKGGTDAAQKTLNAVRAELLHSCEEIQDDHADALVIPESTRASSPITDEDIPF